MKTDLIIQNPKSSDQDIWNLSVKHPLQSWSWGEFREKTDVVIERIGLYKKNDLVAAWQISFHKIPHSDFTIGYFPKGPIPDNLMVKTLIDYGHKHNAIFIQFEPNIIKNNQQPTINNQQLIPSNHPLFTKYNFILDLTKSEDELLKNMHPKTRYNIKVAQKHDVIIREDNSDRALETYLNLSQKTTKRQKFFAHNENYHRLMWETMYKNNIARLFTAEYKKEILAAWIIFLFNSTVYYPYGSSSRMHREVMAPNLLLWEIARWAKKQGCNNFDLWGALGPNPDPKDPWYGFHRFKAGYNPELVEYIGSYDLIIKPTIYRLYKFADFFRWKILNKFK